jgi:hypothetical protein
MTNEQMTNRKILDFVHLDFVIVFLLLIPALQPLAQPALTQSSDGLAHLYRLVALDAVIKQGVLFTRWLPDLVYGYGLPLFVYYPPLSYYLAEIPHLAGLGAVYAFNLSLALALLVSAWGMYLFVRDFFGTRAGLVAAVALAYSPFQLLNIYTRGSLPTAWGMAFFPLVLWVFYRLIVQPGQNEDKGSSPGGGEGKVHTLPSELLPGTLLLAAWLLSHNITTLIFSPLLLVYALLFLVLRPERRAAGRAFLVGSLGVGLALFFLAPALVERDYAQLWRLTTPPDFDFHLHFIEPEELLSWPPVVDTGLLNPVPSTTLGLVHLGLALLGLLGLVRADNRPQRLVVLVSALTLAAAVFMMLPVSVQVWEKLPVLALVQRPSRLLALPALLMAVLAGAAVHVLGRRASARTALWLTAGGILVIVVGAVPLLYPRYGRLPSTDPGLLDMMAYEHASGTIGTTSFGEYLPRWVQQPPPDSPLEPQYRAGQPPDRLDRSYLPAGVTTELEQAGVNRLRLKLSTPQPAQLVFHTFYFPGWRGTVDGEPVEPSPFSERGLIAVTVPAGQSVFELRFRDTTVRRIANLISLAALGLVLLLAFGTRFSARQAGPRFQPLPIGHSLTLLGLGLALLLAKSLYLDRFPSPIKREFDGVHVAGARNELQANFGDQFRLIGFDSDEMELASGQTIDLTLYWQAQVQPSLNYSVLAQLVDTGRNIYGAQDNLHPGQFPTSQWPPWGYVADPHRVPVPPGTPPGDYALVVGLYRPDTWQRLPILTPQLDAWGDVVSLGTVTVARPNEPPSVAELGLTERLERTFAEGLTLLGFASEGEQLVRSDFLRVALFWEAVDPPLPDLQLRLRLRDDGGAVVVERIVRPSNNRYPTTAWQSGERVRDNHALWIPQDLLPGQYTLQIQLLDPDGKALSAWLTLRVYDAS